MTSKHLTWIVCTALIAALFALPVSAQEKEKSAKADAPKEKAPAKKSKIAWESVKSSSGTIVNTTITSTYGGNAGVPRNGKLPYNNNTTVTVRPVYVEFTISSPAAFKVKYKLDPSEERGGRLKISLEKEEERGKNKDWKRKGNIQARVGQEGEQLFTLGPGSYRLELLGEKTKYEFNIEEAVKATE